MIEYDIKWYDHCSFDLISTTNDHEKSIYCTITPKGRNFILVKDNTPYIIQPFEDSNLWFWIEAWKAKITENVFDDIVEKDISVEESFGSMYNFMEYYNRLEILFMDHESYQGEYIQLPDKELKTIRNVFTGLRTYDPNMIFHQLSSAHQSDTLKLKVPDFLYFLKKALGSLEYLSFQKMPNSKELIKVISSDSIDNLLLFNVKFVNFQNEVKCYLSLINEIEHKSDTVLTSNALIFEESKVSEIIFETHDYEPSGFINKVTNEFFDLYYRNKFEMIYENSHESFQKANKKRDVRRILYQIRNSVDQPFEIKKYYLGIHKEAGGVLLCQFEARTALGILVLNLFFTTDYDNMKLLGFDYYLDIYRHR